MVACAAGGGTDLQLRDLLGAERLRRLLLSRATLALAALGLLATAATLLLLLLLLGFLLLLLLLLLLLATSGGRRGPGRHADHGEAARLHDLKRRIAHELRQVLGLQRGHGSSAAIYASSDQR